MINCNQEYHNNITFRNSEGGLQLFGGVVLDEESWGAGWSSGAEGEVWRHLGRRGLGRLVGPPMQNVRCDVLLDGEGLGGLLPSCCSHPSRGSKGFWLIFWYVRGCGYSFCWLEGWCVELRLLEGFGNFLQNCSVISFPKKNNLYYCFKRSEISREKK